jgi:hypothetical protein
MPYSEELDVLSINQATDVITGRMVYQVGFGKIGKPSEAFRTATPGKEIASNILVFLLPLEGECPYKAGSKWAIKVNDDGEMTVQRKKRAK